MSYIPDYRGADNEKHLTEKDRAFLLGYRAAKENAKNFFDNLDVYEVTEEEEKVLNEASECFSDWMDGEERMQVLSIFEGDEYENIELTDKNPKLYNIERGECDENS